MSGVFLSEFGSIFVVFFLVSVSFSFPLESMAAYMFVWWNHGRCFC